MMKGKVLKVMILSFTLALTFGLMPGCGTDSDAKRACEENDTAHVIFQNLRAEDADISVDGVAIGRDIETCDTVARDVVAGIPHLVEFKNSDSGAPLCNPASPSWSRCSSQMLTCGLEDCD